MRSRATCYHKFSFKFGNDQLPDDLNFVGRATKFDFPTSAGKALAAKGFSPYDRLTYLEKLNQNEFPFSRPSFKKTRVNFAYEIGRVYGMWFIYRMHCCAFQNQAVIVKYATGQGIRRETQVFSIGLVFHLLILTKNFRIQPFLSSRTNYNFLLQSSNAVKKHTSGSSLFKTQMHFLCKLFRHCARSFDELFSRVFTFFMLTSVATYMPAGIPGKRSIPGFKTKMID